MKTQIHFFRSLALMLIMIISFGCRKEEAEEIFYTDAGTLTDIDGNIYKAVKIGDQIWMAENLKTSKYRNGDTIPNVTNQDDWDILSHGAHCIYDNALTDKYAYGRLYNWHALKDIRNIAPAGWHIPTKEEWETMIEYIGGTGGAGMKMKSASGWIDKGNGKNSSGFNGFPGGLRFCFSTTTFDYKEYLGYWWTADEQSSYGCAVRLSYDSDDLLKTCNYYKNIGMSVRCIKD